MHIYEDTEANSESEICNIKQILDPELYIKIAENL